MPERFLLQILRDLVTHGILHSTRGVEGGYTLDRRPEDVSLLDVIEAIEGPVVSALSPPEGQPGRLTTTGSARPWTRSPPVAGGSWPRSSWPICWPNRPMPRRQAGLSAEIRRAAVRFRRLPLFRRPIGLLRSLVCNPPPPAIPAAKPRHRPSAAFGRGHRPRGGPPDARLFQRPDWPSNAKPTNRPSPRPIDRPNSRCANASPASSPTTQSWARSLANAPAPAAGAGSSIRSTAPNRSSTGCRSTAR